MPQTLNELMIARRQQAEATLRQAMSGEENGDPGQEGFARGHRRDDGAEKPQDQGQICPITKAVMLGNIASAPQGVAKVSTSMAKSPKPAAKPPADTPLARAIVAYIKRTGTTARALSLQIGDETTVRKVLNGNIKAPRAEAMAKLAEILGQSVQDLLGTTAPPPHPELGEAVMPANDVPPPGPRVEGPLDIPVYGVAAAGADGAFVINLSDSPMDYAPRPMSLIRAQSVFAVTVQGDSMEPVWTSGDVVYCQGGRGYGPGDYVLIQIEAGPGEAPLSYLKRLVRFDDERIVLAQFNPPREIEVARSKVRQVFRALHWRDLR
jgi:phage repressor protein C with HTH and peptisase S24 domain